MAEIIIFFVEHNRGMDNNPLEIEDKDYYNNFVSLSKMAFFDYADLSLETKMRLFLAQFVEQEAINFSHRLMQNCPIDELRRELSLIRRIECFEQKQMSMRLPSIFDTAVIFEYISIMLEAHTATIEPDRYIRSALDFALIEDRHHLFCLGEFMGDRATELLDGYEISAGRPNNISHRSPFDDIKKPIEHEKMNILSNINLLLINATENAIMRFYSDFCQNFTKNIKKQRFFVELGLLEEQHCSHFGSLFDPNRTWLEDLVIHEFCECYLYFCLANFEKNKDAKVLFEQFYSTESSHLKWAVRQLKMYENKDYRSIIGNGELPQIYDFTQNNEKINAYISANSSPLDTAIMGEYTHINNLPKDYEYFKYNSIINKK